MSWRIKQDKHATKNPGEFEGIHVHPVCERSVGARSTDFEPRKHQDSIIKHEQLDFSLLVNGKSIAFNAHSGNIFLMFVSSML